MKENFKNISLFSFSCLYFNSVVYINYNVTAVCKLKKEWRWCHNGTHHYTVYPVFLYIWQRKLLSCSCCMWYYSMCNIIGCSGTVNFQNLHCYITEVLTTVPLLPSVDWWPLYLYLYFQNMVLFRFFFKLLFTEVERTNEIITVLLWYICVKIS